MDLLGIEGHPPLIPDDIRKKAVTFRSDRSWREEQCLMLRLKVLFILASEDIRLQPARKLGTIINLKTWISKRF
jgi:hypothetical protein